MNESTGERLYGAGHRVGRVHAAARPRTGAGGLHNVEPGLVVDLVRHVLPVRLERRDDVEPVGGRDVLLSAVDLTMSMNYSPSTKMWEVG